MTSKLAFRLDHTDEPNRYVIRLVDRKQIAALALAEGLSKPIPLETIAVVHDEGSGELVPVDGFDDTTPQGRVVLRIMDDTYSDVLGQITAHEANRARIANETGGPQRVTRRVAGALASLLGRRGIALSARIRATCSAKAT
jgi:hypothetical protein